MCMRARLGTSHRAGLVSSSTGLPRVSYSRLRALASAIVNKTSLARGGSPVSHASLGARGSAAGLLPQRRYYADTTRTFNFINPKSMGKRKRDVTQHGAAAAAQPASGAKSSKETRDAGAIAPCHVQILGTGYDTLESVPSVLMHFDRARYLFGCGESLQRFCLEYGIKLNKIKPIFLTRVDSHSGGGMPGTMLTLMQNVTMARKNEEVTEDTTFNVIGPRPLHGLIGAARSFVAVQSIGLDAREIRDEESEPRRWLIEPFNPNMRRQGWRQVGSSPLSASSKNATQHMTDDIRRQVRERLGESFEPVFADDSSVVASTRLRPVGTADARQMGLATEVGSNTFDPLMPRCGRPSEPGQPPPKLPAVPRPVLAYAVLLPETRGKFDLEKAKALGLEPGKKFRELTMGKSVQSDADPSVTVTPDMVMSPSTPGAVTIILDCPTVRHVAACLPLSERASMMKEDDAADSDNNASNHAHDQPASAISVFESLLTESCRSPDTPAGDTPTLVVHLAPPEVAAHPLYEKLLECFPAETQHAICSMPSRPFDEDGAPIYVSDTVSINPNNSRSSDKGAKIAMPNLFGPAVSEVTELSPVSRVFLCSAVTQAKLNLLDPYTYPSLVVSDDLHENAGVSLWRAARGDKPLKREGVVQGANMLRYHLRPIRQRGFDVGSVPLKLTDKAEGRVGVARGVMMPRTGQPMQSGGTYALTTEAAKNDIRSWDTRLSKRVRQQRNRLLGLAPAPMGSEEPVSSSSEDEEGSGKAAAAAEVDEEVEKAESPPPSPSKVQKERRALENVPLELIVLGTGSSAPSRYRNVSALYLSKPHDASTPEMPEGMLLDCGEGSYGQLVRHFGPKGAENALRGLRAIWISHIHADHHAGVPKILSVRKKLMPKAPPLLVMGPHMLYPFLKRFEDQVELLNFHFADNKHLTRDIVPAPEAAGAEDLTSYPSGTNLNASLSLHAANEAASRLGMPALSTVRVDHCPEAYGVVLGHEDDSGKVQAHVSYSGDTVFCPEFADASSGARLMVHEATFDDELKDEADKKRHSTVRQALAAGKRASVDRLLLTHFSQRYPKLPGQTESNRSEASRIHRGKHAPETLVAFDLMRVRVDSAYPPTIETAHLVNALFGASTAGMDSDTE